MAAGDVTLYSKYLLGTSDLTTLSSMAVAYGTDTLKLMILKDTHTPDTSDSSIQEHLDDVSSDEVIITGGYTGPITLTTVTATQASDIVSINADSISITADASGFTDGRYAVVYKDSGVEATSPIVCLVDLGSSISIVVNDLQINWGSGKVFTVSKA